MCIWSVPRQITLVTVHAANHAEARYLFLALSLMMIWILGGDALMSHIKPARGITHQIKELNY